MQEVPERHSNSALSSFDEFSRRYQVLLQTADPVARQALPELLLELSKLLHEVVDFNLLSYGLHDPAARKILAYTLDPSILVPEHPLEFSMEGSPLGWVWVNQSSLVIGDVSRETRFPGALQLFRQHGDRAHPFGTMTSTSQRLGVLVFGSLKPSDYETGAVYFLEQIAGLVGLAISNLLTRQAAASEEEQLRALTAVSLQLSERSIRAHHTLQQERARLETVLEINAALAASKLDMKQMFPAIAKSLARTVSHDIAIVNLWNEEQRSYLVFAKGAGHESEFAPPGMVLPSDNAFTTPILAKYPLGTVVRRQS